MTNAQKQKKQLLFEIIAELAKYNPNPSIELNYTNHFTLLIAVLLSAQTTDKNVNKATEELFKIIETPQDVIKMGIEKLEGFLKTLNYYKTKAKHIFETSNILIQNYNSQVPQVHEELTKLPGVGNKTASVMMLQAFNKPAIAVDTHVARISNRLGLVKTKNPDLISSQLLALSHDSQVKLVHHLLVLHGRYVCKKIKPQCGVCKVSHLCNSSDKLMV